MKTAISLPDTLAASADALAKRLGMSRSQLYAAAVARYVTEHERAAITERINAVCAEPGVDTSLDPVLAAIQARSIDPPPDGEPW